jgi:hypothetical protein
MGTTNIQMIVDTPVIAIVIPMIYPSDCCSYSKSPEKISPLNSPVLAATILFYAVNPIGCCPVFAGKFGKIRKCC